MIKQILIICKKFYPDNSPRSFRATELAKEFSRQGHLVTILTDRKPAVHDEFEKKYKVTINDFGKLKWKLVNLGNSKLGILVSKLINHLLLKAIEYPDIELLFRISNAIKRYQNFDLMISIAVPYPVHWGVATIRSKNNKIAKTWIADCGDPYMKNRMAGFGRFFYMKYFEKWFSKKADFISITKTEFIENYYKEFHKKIIVIPQGFNFDEVNLSEQLPSNVIPTFAFAGTFYKRSRDPSVFFNYLLTLNKPFKFILYARNYDYLFPILQKLENKIEIKPIIPREKLLFELSEMDFLINFEYDPKVQSPSKLIDYYLTGRPILNINSDNFKNYEFDQFLEGNYSRKFIFEDMTNFDIKNVTKKFLFYS